MSSLPDTPFLPEFLPGTGLPVPPPVARGTTASTNGAEVVTAPSARPRARGRAPVLTNWRQSMDLVRLSIAGSVIVSISAVHMYLGPMRYLRPAFTFTVVAVALAVLKPKLVVWKNIREAWPAIAVIAFFIMCLISGIFGLSPGGTARFIVDLYWKVLLGFLVKVIAIRSAKDLAMITWSFVISVGIVVILSFTVLDMNTTNEGLGRLDGGSTMFDANDIGMIFLMALPLALMLVLNSGLVGRATAFFVLCGIPLVVALTGSRGAMVGLATVLPLIFLSLSRINIGKRLGGTLLILITLALSAPPGYWKQMETIVKPEGDYNRSDDYGRIGIAKRGVGYMLRYPLTGVGAANFPRAEGTISPIARARGAAGESIRWIAPHNTYVQVGAELGIPGLTIWLSLLLGGSVGLWRLRRRIPKRWDWESADRRFLREMCLFLPISYVAFAVTSFFLTHAFTPPAYIIFALHAGLIVLVRRELKKDRLERQALAVRQ